ncbi:MAG: DNA mismatch repair protein MutS [Gemmatimonadales bacterium]
MQQGLVTTAPGGPTIAGPPPPSSPPGQAHPAGSVSLLWPESAGDGPPDPEHPPACFGDLLLDRVVSAVTALDVDAGLEPVFWQPLDDPDTIRFRQDIMRDLEGRPLRDAVEAFVGAMASARRHLAPPEPGAPPEETARRRLDAAAVYCEAIMALETALPRHGPRSRGLQAAGARLSAYRSSPAFRSLAADTRRLLAEAGSIRYLLRLAPGEVTVLPFRGEPDQAAGFLAAFRKFQPPDRTRGRAAPLRTASGPLDRLERRILHAVARLHPATFQALAGSAAAQGAFLDPAIVRFDREVRFYLAYLKLADRLRVMGLPFCYPEITTRREVESRDGFDLALAVARAAEGRTVVTNDLHLAGRERIAVITGPNHGGKTTLARMFGQLHYLAALGCPVPGTGARLARFDRLFTHFERQESVASLRGRLLDDLVRIRRILEQATRDSIVIVNEFAAATASTDALYLGRKLLGELSRRNLLAVWVTFLDELGGFDEKTVSLVGGVDPDDPEIRTYRFARRPADGLAFALALAEKFRVTRDWLDRRLEGRP